MRTLLRWLGRGVAGLILLIVAALAVLAFTNRDLPVEQLEARYGGADLQRVEVHGVPLRYKVSGNGPPLLLLHSHFYNMRQWDSWVEELQDDFTLVRFDLTSHGLTGPDPTGDYSRARGVALILGLLDHLGLERVHVAGSSTGGGLAWTLAADQPDRVDHLVLINAPGMPRVTNKYMERELPDWGGYLLYVLPRDLFRPFLEAPVVDNSLITDALLEEFHLMYRREGNRLAEYRRMQAWEKGDITETLARIKAPTLILWGEDNPQLPVEHVGQYREKLVNASHVASRVYPGIGHVIPLEAPLRSARDTRRFLQGGTL